MQGIGAFFGTAPIPCMEGVLQGDTLGSTFFSLGIHPVIEELAAEFPELRLRYYCDDGNILGRRSTLSHPRRLGEFIRSAAHKFAAIGLKIRLDKSSI